MNPAKFRALVRGIVVHVSSRQMRCRQLNNSINGNRKTASAITLSFIYCKYTSLPHVCHYFCTCRIMNASCIAWVLLFNVELDPHPVLYPSFLTFFFICLIIIVCFSLLLLTFFPSVSNCHFPTTSKEAQCPLAW